MRARRTILAAALVAGLALTGTAVSQTHGSGTPTASTATARVSAHAARSLHRFRGAVTTANSAHHWFRMRTSSRSVRIHTGNATRWDGCDWDDMDPGHRVDVRAYRQHGAWIARSIQDWRGGGHGGRHDGPHPGHMMR